jgi:16S rRNA (cytosine967-C5)-methyltransferase
MKFPAQVQASIDILDIFLTTLEPIDRILKEWAHRNRYAGSSDRRIIKDIVYECLRNKRSLVWMTGEAETGYSILYGYCLKHNLPISEIFTGEKYAPKKPEEQHNINTLKDSPDAVFYDIPDWFPQIDTEDLIYLSQSRAPIDLRVNLKKATVAEAKKILLEEGLEVSEISFCETALRTQSGSKINSLTIYKNGIIEIQDASSQSAMLHMPEGKSVLDFCAGGGGKSLALAAQGRQVIAYDQSFGRMKDLPVRAQRAGASIEIIENLEHLNGRKFNVVLVDAPCSGSGAWRRNPAEKWRLTPERLAELQDIQLDILSNAIKYVEREDYLVYCTCSLFDEENIHTVLKFEDRFSSKVERQHIKTWKPSKDDCDGFFQCIWKVL